MWSKIDDKLHSSQQQRTAGLEAMGLWTLGESYCGDQLTDGFIPAWFVIEKTGSKRKGVALADKLVAAGLWYRAVLVAEKGWNSVGYLDRNKSKEWVLADRAKTAKRLAEWRRKQAELVALAEQGNAVTNGVSNALPDPTRPDPTRSPVVAFDPLGCVSDEGANATKPGTSPARVRADDDFLPSNFATLFPSSRDTTTPGMEPG